MAVGHAAIKREVAYSDISLPLLPPLLPRIVTFCKGIRDYFIPPAAVLGLVERDVYRHL